MLKLSKVKLNNFWSYPTAVLEFNHKDPVLILGHNSRSSHSSSNGAGKSSLLYSVLWGLFGKVGMSITADSVVNTFYKKDCSVTVEGTSNAIPFTITRYRKHSVYSNELHFKFNNYDCRGASTAETQQKIEAELSIDFSSFMQSSFFNPSVSNLFCTLTDTAQKEVFYKLLNLDKWNLGYKAVKEEEDKLKEQQAQQTSIYEHLVKEKTTHVEQLKKYLRESANARQGTKKEEKRLQSGVKTLTDQAVTEYNSITLCVFDEKEYKKTYNSQVTLKHELSKLSGLKKICSECGQDIDQKKAGRSMKIVEKELIRVNKEMKAYLEDKKRFGLNKELNYSIEKKMNGIKMLLAEIDTLEYKSQVIKNNLDNIKDKVKSNNKKIYKLRKIAIELAKKFDLIRVLKLAFSNQGVKAYIINTVIPVLNKEINSAAQQLIGPQAGISISSEVQKKSGDVKNKFGINIQGFNNNNYFNCSSGEKRKIDICVLLGFSATLRSLNNGCNFVVFDELVDNLDNISLEKCVELIKELKYDNIFIITHNEELKNHFNTVMIIEKDNLGRSSIRLASDI